MEQPGAASGGREPGVSRREFLASVAKAGAGAGLQVGLPRWVRGGPGRPKVEEPGFQGADSLRAHGAARGLLVGCAVDVDALSADEAYAGLVKEQANIVVGEKAMTWKRLRPSSDSFDFSAGDALIAFAEANRMRVRGHALCSHRDLPDWFAAEATTKNARTLLTEHIERVAGRYAGRMHSWDVVDEAVSARDGRPDGLRDSPWLRLIGEEYIEIAFHAARRADPQALLTYNQDAIEGEDAASQGQRAATLLLLRRLKARNVPVDAVGIESHLRVGPRYGEGRGLADFLEEMRELGLQVLLTELDVSDPERPVDVKAGEKAVAQVYGGYLDRMLKDSNVTAVLTWGLADWRAGIEGKADGGAGRGLPFDAGMKPTEAFFAMRDALDRRVMR